MDLHPGDRLVFTGPSGSEYLATYMRRLPDFPGVPSGAEIRVEARRGWYRAFVLDEDLDSGQYAIRRV